MQWPIYAPPWPQPSLTNHWAKMTRTAQRPIAMIWPRPCARAAQTRQARKSAPLRLVAEQRIDEPAAEAPEIAVPAPAPKQEVAVNDTNETQAQPVKSSDFADFGQFVAHVGAHLLEAKLEAAATYLS